MTAEVFWTYVDREGPVFVPATGRCWTWTADLCSRGYGQIGWKGHSKLAHRRAYELLVGPIPDGLVLDHLCRNQSCVNPAHLEPVTRAENNRRNPRGGWNFRGEYRRRPQSQRMSPDGRPLFRWFTYVDGSRVPSRPDTRGVGFDVVCRECGWESDTKGSPVRAIKEVAAAHALTHPGGSTNHAPERLRTGSCPSGHEFNEANTYLRRDGGRSCRACARKRRRGAVALRRFSVPK